MKFSMWLGGMIIRFIPKNHIAYVRPKKDWEKKGVTWIRPFMELVVLVRPELQHTEKFQIVLSWPKPVKPACSRVVPERIVRYFSLCFAWLTVKQFEVKNAFHAVEMIIQWINTAVVVLFCILGNYQVRYTDTINAFFYAFVLIINDLCPIVRNL